MDRGIRGEFPRPGRPGGGRHPRGRAASGEDGLGIAGKAAFGIGGVVTSWDYRRLTEPSQDDPFPRFEECLPEPSVVDIGWVSVEGGTRVKLRHENLPELLGPAVTDLWRYYLARPVRHCETGTWGDHPWDDARRTGGRPQASRRPAG
ncbi:conserved hypothetical protein [Parafrankia sp. Ea1.12]|nr:conserved hypothetical protein [Parafrankia sp. Ea1.12]